EMMKHIFAIVLTPPAVHVLQVAGAVYKDDRWPAALPIRRPVDASIHNCAIARFEAGNRRIDPVVSEEFGDRRSRYLLDLRFRVFLHRPIRQQVKLRWLIAV